MNTWINLIVLLLVLTNLKLLGSSRLISCLRIVALQGILLGVLPLITVHGSLEIRMLVQAAVSTSLKGLVLPWLLLRAVREVNARREVEPFVGFTMSLLAGVLMLGLSYWLATRLPALSAELSNRLIPVAIFTICVGLFIIVSRKTAVVQVLGYLAMENGIYAFGMSLAENQPMLVELGILLDVFVAVFVMGIAIYNINREFDHLDTDQLSALKD